jgi:long-chain acyl-CoA synthetase
MGISHDEGMRTLQELLPELDRLGDREAVLHRGPFRTRRWSYRELTRHIRGVVEHFDERGLAPGERVLLWGENRPEWVAVFWAAVARGLVVVPMDFRSSAALVSRVQGEVNAKLVIYGSTVDRHGSSVVASTVPNVASMSLEAVGDLVSTRKLDAIDVEPSDVVQIIYTSGTTGAPKGVVHRHRNLVANLTPIRDEARKFTTYMRPFQPIRTLELLPLSHVFGQFTGLFVPVIIGGAVAFLDEVHPGAIIDTLRRERISILSTVPRFLSSLRSELERRFELDTTDAIGAGLWGGVRRWWRHRDVHSTLGWKFWAIVSGGARLEPEDEEFWYRLGLVLVQGYGMTETSSMVTTNHPLHPKRGSLGKAVGNQQIKLAPDGEILVRGDNVSLETWGEQSSSDPGVSAWLHTGDLGEIRDDGVLYYKGRKKDVIVRADALNVYPSDVEAALNRRPEIRQAVVVGRSSERGDVVHAVLLMATGRAEDAIRAANNELEPHQRVQEWTVWPDDDFPRTESTFKIKRHEIVQRLAAPAAPREGRGVRDILARQLRRARDELGDSDKLSEELGLTSLDRVELLTNLERELGRDLSETDLSHVETVEELETWAAHAPPPSNESSPLNGLARYGRIAPIRWVRTIFRELVIRPLFRHYLPLTVEGDLEGARAPVIFAANHQSNLDTLAVLTALPYAWRQTVAPVVQQEYFDAHLEKRGSVFSRIAAALEYWLAIVLVNAFPLPRSGTSTRPTMRFAGRLVDEGYSILIFPEGRLTRDGAMNSFKPGVGLLAVRLGVPVVPIHLDGLFSVLSFRDRWPQPGPVRVRFGSPLRFHETDSFDDATRRIEAAVKNLSRRSG